MDTVSWAFNFVPWWVWVVAVIVAAVVTYQFWMPIWLSMPRWLKGLILGIAALFTAYVAGRNRGAKDERNQRAKADARAIQTRKESPRLPRIERAGAVTPAQYFNFACTVMLVLIGIYAAFPRWR